MKKYFNLLAVFFLITFLIAGCSGSSTTTTVVQGSSPVIQSLSVQGLPATPGSPVTATVVAQSAQGLALTYTWTATSPWSVSPSSVNSQTAAITAPSGYAITGTAIVEVSDTHGRYALNTIPLSTVGDIAPVINSITASPNPAPRGGTIIAQVTAFDVQGNKFTESWAATTGWGVTGYGTTATVIAPDTYSTGGYLTVTVSDQFGAAAASTIALGTQPDSPPVITGFSASPNPAAQGGEMAISVTATSPDGNHLSYTWQAPAGWIFASGQGTRGITVTAPALYNVSGTFTVTVSDSYGGTVSLPIPVSTVGNSSPIITGLSATPNPIVPTGTMAVTVSANDPDGDTLGYTWTVPAGWTLATGQGTSGISIKAPNQFAAGGKVTVTVSDGNGDNVSMSLYVSTSQLGQMGPQITNFIISPNPLNPETGFGGTNTTALATVTATNPEGGSLTYAWSITSTTSGWSITGSGVTGTITAPLVSNITATVSVIADNGTGLAAFSTSSISTGLVETSYSVGTNPQGIAIDSSGNVWVTNTNSNNVAELSPTGVTITTVTVGTYPHGIAIDASGNVWVTNNGGSCNVTELSSAGATNGTYPVGSGPEGIAIDASGNVWVANYYSDNVTELSPTGTTITTVTVGTNPQGIAIDSSGNVWVTNWGSNNVTELSPTGTTLGPYAVGGNPWGIAIDTSGNVWVANVSTNNVTELSPIGATITTVTVGTYPRGIAIDASGNVWVTNNGSNNVTELSPTGTTLGTYAVGSGPVGIAIDASGNVWVANGGSNNVTELMGITTGPQYFPYTGPQFPGGGNE